MNLIIPIIFVTTALIQLGILINLLSLIKIYPNEKALKYWAGSLLASAVGIISIAIGSAIMASLSQGTLFLTFANAIYFSSTVLLLFYCRSLSKPLTQNYINLNLCIIVIYTILFEVVRHRNSFIDRQIFAAISQFFIYTAQVIEIHKYKNQEKSKFISIFKITVSIELALLVIRIAILISQDYGFIDSLNEVPIIPLSLLWALLIINIWSYISIHGFWTERIVSINTKSKIENTKIRKLLEEKYKLINSLMTANKTAVSGALSASIAHEINQPLGAIKINSQHLSMLIKGKKEKVIIDNIIKDNDKAAKIISTLKNIFVSKDNSFKRVNFERFIKSINPLFEDATRDKNISMKLIINSPVEININPDEVQQALFNLLNNSIQALSKSSKKNKLIQIKTYIKKNKLICSFLDNGPGVNSKLKNKIFNLYETSSDHNIGLGLWLVKYIITRHNGTISLNKKYLKGAEFLIELPIYKNA